MSNFKFTKAIVRRPSPSMIHGITSADLGVPNFATALQQHQAYIEALEKIGLEVIILEANDAYPDACFVEDVAVLTSDFAILTNPGADSRRGEKHLIELELQSKFERFYRIEIGTLDGGDVMMVGKQFFVGLSDRTNQKGINEFRKILKQEGYTVCEVNMKEMLHLKTGVNYLENNTLTVFGEFEQEALFEDFRQIKIAPNDAYAANSVWINGTVLVPAGFKKVAQQIAAHGYKVIELKMSEFQKLDGGLSCLSLRY